MTKPYRVIALKERQALAQSLAPVPRVALSLAEAAEALGVCEETMRGLTKCGKVPSFTQGRRVLVRVAALEAYALAEEARHLADLRAHQETEARRRSWAGRREEGPGHGARAQS